VLPPPTLHAARAPARPPARALPTRPAPGRPRSCRTRTRRSTRPPRAAPPPACPRRAPRTARRVAQRARRAGLLTARRRCTAGTAALLSCQLANTAGVAMCLAVTDPGLSTTQQRDSAAGTAVGTPGASCQRARCGSLCGRCERRLCAVSQHAAGAERRDSRQTRLSA